MRKLTIVLLACAVLTSLAIVTMGVEPFALEDLHLIHWEQVPDGRPSYTGPVSAAVLMAWYAEHGYPELLPDLNQDGQTNEEDTLLLARDFGEEMGGQMVNDKLADPFIVYPLARYIAERYPNEFRMFIYDESFPEEVERDMGQPFNPTEIGGLALEVHEDPFYELYVHYLEAQRPGIVGIGYDIPEWNDFSVSRSYIPAEEPEGWPVDLVSTGYEQFTDNPVWETLLRLDPDRWGFLTPEWVPFEILIILLPAEEADGAPGNPGDNPGGDPGDPGDPGNDPGGDPTDPGGGDQPRYPGQPGGDPGGDPRFPPGFDGDGVCCLPDGSCDSTLSSDACARLGGTFNLGGTCATVECPPTSGDPCAAVDGEITDICYTYENGILSVYVSYAVHNHGPVMANDITIYGLVGLNDGINGLGGGPECQDWQYGVDIAAGSTYVFDRTYSTSAPTLDLNNLSYLYGSLWLQVEAPWDCWPITQQAFVQTWDPAPRCYPSGNPGTPPGGSNDGQPTGSVADVQISMKLVAPSSDPVAPGSQAQYNLLVWQAGPATAENVVVELTLPSSVTVSGSAGSAIQTAHRPPNDVLRWDLGDLTTFPPGTSIWLQVDVDQDACGTVLYDFSVTSDTTDPDLSNNSGSLATLIDPCDGGGTPPGGEGEPIGACCLPSGQCIETGITNCDSQGGEFRGEGSTCEGSDCPSGSSEGDCPALSAAVTEACYDYRGPNESVLVRATFSIDNFGTAMAQTPWFEAKATYDITVQETTTTYVDYYSGYAPDIPAGGSTTFTHEFDLGVIGQEPSDGILVDLLSRINSPCIDFTETTGTNWTTLRCPTDDDGTGEPGEPDPEPGPQPDPEPDPEPDPQPTLLPNLWVTGMTGCWTWSSGGDEHVIATVTGIVHNGGQADAANVRATITAGGRSTTVSAGTISAGGQKTVSATIDVGAYDSVSWPVSTSIEADPTHAITEADESNNTTTSAFPQSSDCN